MNSKQIYIILSLLLLITISIKAQNGTSSPYSIYGIGVIDNNANAQLSAMGFSGIAVLSGEEVNTLNPASLVGIDSTKFKFNLQFSGSLNTLETSSRSQSNFDSNIELITIAFKVHKRWGMSFKLLPYSNVGYNISTTKEIYGTQNEKYDIEYNGSGGLTEIAWSHGVQIFKNLSLGVNLSYLWGQNTNTEVSYFSNLTGTTLNSVNMYHYSNFNIEYGLQYHFNINENNKLALGVVYGSQRNMSSTIETEISNSSGYVLDSDENSSDDFQLPEVYSGGISYQSSKGFMVNVDYAYQNWGTDKVPGSSVYYQNSNHIHGGIEYTPQKNYFKSVFNRMKYRVGAFYDQNYFKLNGSDLAKQGFTAGVRIPLRNSSAINVAYEWSTKGQTGASLMKETYNTFRIGLSFNETWFQKRKFE